MTMTKNEAKLELFIVERKIEKKIVEHKNELGQHNKSCIMDELQILWDMKDTLKKIISGFSPEDCKDICPKCNRENGEYSYSLDCCAFC